MEHDDDAREGWCQILTKSYSQTVSSEHGRMMQGRISPLKSSLEEVSLIESP